MRKLILILLFFTFQFANAQQADVKKVIEEFFVAFHAKDTIKIKDFCDDKMMLKIIEENKNQVFTESFSDFLKSIAGAPKDMKFQENLLSYDIKIDGKLASVWSPYEFYINGKLSHKGVDVFQLFYDEKQWKIISLIYNIR
ncbi:formate-dependent nitrite reductase cytochrome c552 subunit [Flavobacterium arsenatis]|uniref:Formate-dependent nitrite reductase cytochrome c552 subunit n=1 Tax=Flavobacterium arsenatis TaxID=1484332 RepID=A0ABU1TU01_9FLAO|nr:nuclear transport factor 2 family protein [Flavobacterium arsenatis]MDR6969353.1 formate-dependent nitrite reductase cytochrome c552 subunit [Flavobacterium arsenatis]